MLRGQLWRLQGKSWARPLRGRGATVLKTTEPRTLRAPPCRCSREAAQPGETSVDEVDDVATADFTTGDWDEPLVPDGSSEAVYLVGVEFTSGENFLTNTSAESAKAVQDLIASGESLQELERLAHAAGEDLPAPSFHTTTTTHYLPPYLRMPSFQD